MMTSNAISDFNINNDHTGTIEKHHENLKTCKSAFCDILYEFLDEGVLTPGETVSCFRDALQMIVDNHQQSLNNSKAALELISQISKNEDQ